MRLDLAQAYCLKERFKDAETPLTEALKWDPNNAPVHYLFALVQISQNLYIEPLDHYQKAIAAQPGIDRSPTLHDRWGANYARAGLYPQAILAAEKARSLARSLGQESYAREIDQRLDTYRRQSKTPATFR